MQQFIKRLVVEVILFKIVLFFLLIMQWQE